MSGLQVFWLLIFGAVVIERLGQAVIELLEWRDRRRERADFPRATARHAMPRSPTLERLIEEVRNEQVDGAAPYDRMHRRHNRS